MTEQEILDLNRKMVEMEIGAQNAKGVEKLKLMWGSLQLKKELEIYV